MVGKVRLVGIIVGIPTKNHVVGNWSESRPNELVGTLSEISDLSPTKMPVTIFRQATGRKLVEIYENEILFIFQKIGY